MSSTVSSTVSAPSEQAAAPHVRAWNARAARGALLLCVAAAIGVGVVMARTDAARAAAAADPDLTRLLRAMAALKVIFAAAAFGAVLFRLGVPVTLRRFAVYAASCAAMAAGPALIWGMADLRAGAVLLHGGLLVAVVALWRDPAVATRLSALLASRRAR